MDPEDIRKIGIALQNSESKRDLKSTDKELKDLDDSFFMIASDPVQSREERPLRDIRLYVESKKKAPNSTLDSDELFNITSKIPIKKAINDWLTTIENPDTKRKYKRSIERVFKLYPLNEAIEKNRSITTLDKNYAGTIGVYKLIEEIDASRSSVKICQSVYSRFCDFIRIATFGTLDPEESPKQKEGYYATSTIYRDINWKEFISSMRTPFDLLAEMTFLAAEACEFRLRLVNSRKNVLTLDTSQIDFQNHTISFRAEQSYHITDILGYPLRIPFPESFMMKLENYLEERKGTVFLSKKNKPLFSMQVQREFKRVSKNLPYEITPVMLGWAGVLAYKEEQEKKSYSK